jgi:hypothetical protein
VSAVGSGCGLLTIDIMYPLSALNFNERSIPIDKLEAYLGEGESHVR